MSISYSSRLIMLNLVLFVFLLTRLPVDSVVLEDPARDGYIIDSYVDNVKELLKHYNIATVQMPDFDFLPNHFWGISGRNGTFGNLERISRVNISTLTHYSDGMTNLDAIFFLPNANLHYRLTTFYEIGLDFDICFFINAIRMNFNYTAQFPCSIDYNAKSVDVLLIQESTILIRVDFLHDRWFIPQFVADFIEKFMMASLGQLFVDYELLTLGSRARGHRCEKPYSFRKAIIVDYSSAATESLTNYNVYVKPVVCIDHTVFPCLSRKQAVEDIHNKSS